MNGLIIDTSASLAYLALSKGGQVVFSQTFPAMHHLSKFLLPSIASLLQGAPDYIAVGAGPGSYTGTRMGGIVAKTLAFAWKIPLIPFSSSLLPDLETIAKNCYENFQKGEFSQLELVYFSSEA